ncbi:LNS2 domain-containing protein [Aphelenchoides bicaudatus]|nr:LNS2 domain-containing protein [Aphelenchoides bicaudatus]
MEYVYSFYNNVKYYWDSTNPAYLSGAIDVIVVEQPDGNYLSTPFHVHFGKWAVWNIEDKFVDIQINGKNIEEIRMKLADNGVAFFIDEMNSEEAPISLDVKATQIKPGPLEKQIIASAKNSPEASDAEFAEELQKKLEKQVKLSSSQSPGKRPKSPSLSDASVSTGSPKKLSRSSSLTDASAITCISPIGSIAGIQANTPTREGRKNRYTRTLRLTSEQLKELKLQYGSNKARFSISSAIQGTAWCTCRIYLLRHTERIVISDIDGTITKSDVLGHIIPAIGGTWAHTNIVSLYRRIQDNGYRIVYLSSRAIGQSYQTKRYLRSVIQDSKTLPDGPVLLSPTSILVAFRKEVIEKRPDEFKIACLTELLNLFPNKAAFYAGFGNRETDIKSYLAVGIPPTRILIIDTYGKVRNVAHTEFSTNYDIMIKNNIVDCLFPPFIENTKQQKSHTPFTYWTLGPTEINEDEMKSYEQDRENKQQENKKKSGGRMRFFTI